jgi:hypothetical protein
MYIKITITIATIIAIAAILSLSVFSNAYAADDTQKSDTDKVTTKEKHDKGLPPPGVPVVRSDKQHHHNNNGGSPPPPGVPVIRNHGGDGGYNNDNIKKFDTSKSLFRSSDSGSSSKIIEYIPGFNDTFFNSTLPYCFAVTSGSCYDTSRHSVIP